MEEFIKRRTEVGGRPGEISCAVTSSISLGKEDGGSQKSEDRGQESEVRDRRAGKDRSQLFSENNLLTGLI